jgi:hypothetical protein
MKFHFNDKELSKLREIILTVLPSAALRRDEDGGAIFRTLAKMKHKFGPEGQTPVTFLGGKERDALLFMVNRRIEVASIPAMEFTLKAIQEKLDV